MKIYAKTDTGLVRQSNEDAYFYKEKDKDNFIAFVCDGMGGHIGGSYAANKTIEIIDNAYRNPDIKSVGVWLYETIQKANDAIYNQAKEQPEFVGMGTTCSGVICHEGKFYYAHVGDSRIYTYDANNISQITTDHTLVNTLLQRGYITYKQAKTHPKRHVLTNALGINKEISVDIGEIPLNPHENIIICSDGLHNCLDGKKLLKALNSTDSIIEKGDELINKINSMGGPDNITFILLESEDLANA